MVSTREEVPEPIKRLGARLKSALLPFVSEERQAEAARRKFEKAVFRSQSSVEEFEASLDNHRHKMRDLGEAISQCVKEVRKNWKKAQKLGPHESKAYKAIAKTYFKRVLALEERIDAHLNQFEKKLHVLTAWRQYKIQNDIGSEVDVDAVQEFIGENFDQLDINDQTFEAEEGERIGIGIREQNDGTVVNEEEEELLTEWVEEESPDTASLNDATEGDADSDDLSDEFDIDEPLDSDDVASGDGTGTPDISDVKEFVGEEFN